MRRKIILWAALAALSAAQPMTVLAAEGTEKGWHQESDGRWYYLNKDGERKTETWIHEDSGYYYLDADGYMAVDSIIDDGSDIYYVDIYGCRIASRWVSRPNEDNACDQDVDTLWYYFNDRGRAEKEAGKIVTIKNASGGDEWYTFDEDGHMLSGWQRITNSKGETNIYYMGDENQGFAHLMWQYLEPDYDFMENPDEDYDSYEMFYFGWDGKMSYAKESNLEGEHYYFDENGVRLTGWQPGITPSDPDFAVNKYYSEETGIRASGWLYAYDQDDGDENGDPHWFYCDPKSGYVFNEGGKDSDDQLAFKRIDGDFYFFDEKGRMISGLIATDGTDLHDNPFAAEDYEQYQGDIGKGNSARPAGIYYLSLEESSLGELETDGKLELKDGDERYSYYLSASGRAYTNALINGSIYGSDGLRLESDDGSWQLLTLEEDVYAKSAFVRGTLKEDAQPLLTAGTDVAVSKSGKVKKSGTIKIDEVKYTVDSYAAVEAED